MSLPKRVARFAAAACVAAGLPAAADYRGEYADAWLGESLRHARRDVYWGDLVSRPPRLVERAPAGARTWVAREENPWANAYGTPSSRPWTATSRIPRSAGAVRLCSCYLADDLRSWDGGPLTDADIARLCRTQCF